MYHFYMDKVRLPIPPKQIQTTINNQNKTINLMNEGEVNIIKPAGLTTIKFEISLPLMTKYPFAVYKNKEFLTANYFLSHFQKLKTEKTTFQFIISRWKYDPSSTKATKKENVMKTNMTVTLENYTVEEDTDYAPDIMVSLVLKQYVKYGTVTKKIDLDSNTVTKSKMTASSKKAIPNTYIVKKGDTLWTIAKKLLGDGAKCWNLAKYNNISNPNRIYVGQVLKIKDVKATTAPASSSRSPSSNNSSSSSSSNSTGKKNTSVGKAPFEVTSAADKFNAMQKMTQDLTGTSGRSSGGGGRSIDPKTSVVNGSAIDTSKVKPNTNKSSGTRAVSSGRDYSKVKRNVR